MAIMGKIWENARKLNKVIALPEGSEPRTLKAAEKIKSEKLANVILLGNPEKILKSAKDANANIDGITIVEPKSSGKYDEYVNIFFELRKNKGITLEKAKEIVEDKVEIDVETPVPTVSETTTMPLENSELNNVPVEEENEAEKVKIPKRKIVFKKK